MGDGFNISGMLVFDRDIPGWLLLVQVYRHAE
jgi:hypothetical protein